MKVDSTFIDFALARLRRLSKKRRWAGWNAVQSYLTLSLSFQ
jgi:hypothetical protein